VSEQHKLCLPHCHVYFRQQAAMHTDGYGSTVAEGKRWLTQPSLSTAAVLPYLSVCMGGLLPEVHV